MVLLLLLWPVQGTGWLPIKATSCVTRTSSWGVHAPCKHAVCCGSCFVSIGWWLISPRLLRLPHAVKTAVLGSVGNEAKHVCACMASEGPVPHDCTGSISIIWVSWQQLVISCFKASSALHAVVPSPHSSKQKAAMTVAQLSVCIPLLFGVAAGCLHAC